MTRNKVLITRKSVDEKALLALRDEVILTFGHAGFSARQIEYVFSKCQIHFTSIARILKHGKNISKPEPSA